MSAAEPTPTLHRDPWCECSYDIATGRRVSRCPNHQPSKYPVGRTCADCEEPYEDFDNDATCPACRAKRTAHNLAPATCHRTNADGTVCGNPLQPAVFRSWLCSDCQNDDLIENIRRYGSE